MSEEEYLSRLAKRAHAITQARRPQLLGEFLGEYITEQVQLRCKLAESVAVAWKEVVPQNLAGCCRVGAVAHGKVKVLVSSPSYLHQLRTMESRLLAQLQQRTGKRAVKHIRFEIGG